MNDARLEFYPTWPDVLKASTSFSIGWSYIIAWVGVGLAFISSLSYSTAAICIRTEIQSLHRKAENLISVHGGAGNAICQHPQLFHPQFLPHPTGGNAPHSYMGGSQLSLNHPEMPPMPLHGSAGYYSVGYPTLGSGHHVYNDCGGGDTRTLQYKHVVKELEDAKL